MNYMWYKIYTRVKDVFVGVSLVKADSTHTTPTCTCTCAYNITYTCTCMYDVAVRALQP